MDSATLNTAAGSVSARRPPPARSARHAVASVIQRSSPWVKRLTTVSISRGFVMTDMALNSSMAEGAPVQPASRPNLDKGFNPLTMILFFGILAAGMLFVAYSIYVDIDATGTRVTTYLPYILLFIALLIALGFEFVNGFHDTANAVATVIYTHSLPAEFAA